ncbi:MAG: glucitol/sorbitol-specific PTS transporter subunit IIC [Tissierellia bacterium]|nr:glucitol/sorbitol-specific PTS transporter subunit IIC [Tissierellia bacterium]
MKFLIDLASGFMNLFELGGETFVSWVTGIVPKVLLLLVFMNALIALIGPNKVNKFAKYCSKSKILAYGILPFISAFMLGNPMALSMGKFLPEFMKPSYYASAAQHCHTNLGIFPHINVGELFTWLGIAQGVEALGLDVTDLAIRYLLVGLVMNFFAGWVTDFTTRYVERQQGIRLKREIRVES